EQVRPRLTVASAPAASQDGADGTDGDDGVEDSPEADREDWTAGEVEYSDPAVDRYGEDEPDPESTEVPEDTAPENLPGQTALDLGEAEPSAGSDKGRGRQRKSAGRTAGTKSKRPSVPS